MGNFFLIVTEGTACAIPLPLCPRQYPILYVNLWFRVTRGVQCCNNMLKITRIKFYKIFFFTPVNAI